MAEPLVSVIMPAYNAAATIIESVQCVLDQTHRNLELIVVDDGSNDDTVALVEAIGDPRIRLVAGDHQGVSAARNRGLEIARGDFIKYLDSDDLLNDRAVEAQLAKLAASPGLALCTSAWGRFWTSLDDLKVVRAKDWTDLSVIEFLQLSLGGGGTMPVMTWMIPKALADKAGPWRVGAQLYEDSEYHVHLAVNCDRVVFTEEAWGYYRTKPSGTLSTARDGAAYRGGLICVETLTDRVLALGDDPRIRPMLANYWRRYTVASLGRDDDLAALCERKVAEFGGSNVIPGGGLVYRMLRSVFGWKTASWIRRRLGH